MMWLVEKGDKRGRSPRYLTINEFGFFEYYELKLRHFCGKKGLKGFRSIFCYLLNFEFVRLLNIVGSCVRSYIIFALFY